MTGRDLIDVIIATGREDLTVRIDHNGEILDLEEVSVVSDEDSLILR